MLNLAGIGKVHSASHGLWVSHQMVSPLRAVTGSISVSIQPPAFSPVWGREKLSELMSETLWLGLASKGVINQLWDYAQRRLDCVCFCPWGKLHLWLLLGTNKRLDMESRPWAGYPLGTMQGGSNLEYITIDRSPRFGLIKQIIKVTQISGRVTLPH